MNANQPTHAPVSLDPARCASSRFVFAFVLTVEAAFAVLVFHVVFAQCQWHHLLEYAQRARWTALGSTSPEDLQLSRQLICPSSSVLPYLDTWAHLGRPLRFLAFASAHAQQLAVTFSVFFMISAIARAIARAMSGLGTGSQPRRGPVQECPTGRRRFRRLNAIGLVCAVHAAVAVAVWYLTVPRDRLFFQTTEQCHLTWQSIAIWSLLSALTLAAAHTLALRHVPITETRPPGTCARCRYDSGHAYDVACSECGWDPLASAPFRARARALVFGIAGGAILLAAMAFAVIAGMSNSLAPLIPAQTLDWLLVRDLSLENHRRKQLLRAYFFEDLLIEWPSQTALVRLFALPPAETAPPQTFRVLAATLVEVHADGTPSTPSSALPVYQLAVVDPDTQAFVSIPIGSESIDLRVDNYSLVGVGPTPIALCTFETAGVIRFNRAPPGYGLGLHRAQLSQAVAGSFHERRTPDPNVLNTLIRPQHSRTTPPAPSSSGRNTSPANPPGPTSSPQP